MISGAPATGGQGTGASFFNNFLGGGGNSNPTPTPDPTPVAPAADPTAVVTPPTSSLISTSGQSRTTFNQNSSTLADALAKLGGSQYGQYGQADPNQTDDDSTGATTATDPIINGLNTLQTNSDAATKSLIASTQAAYQNKVNAVNKQYGSYKAGLQQLGVETNEAEATPDLLSGHIQQAANDQMSKISDLSAQESKTLMDAQTAKNNNDFKTLQALTDRYKAIQTAKSDAIKNMYDTLSSTSKASTIEAHDIYGTLQTLDPADKESFIQAVAQKYNLPLNDLVTALTDEQGKQTVTAAKVAKAAGGGSTATGSISKAQISLGEQKLNASKGDDGFVDPFVYQSAYSDWTAKGGTTKAFIAAYPPKDYVNPDATNLPSYLMPGKSKSGSSSSSSSNSFQP